MLVGGVVMESWAQLATALVPSSSTEPACFSLVLLDLGD